MADYIFDSWKKLMTDFRQSVQKDLEEIHAQKQAVQQMKAEIFSRMDSGRYYRDPERIVISAPEIVIGNVDYSGDLMGGSSTVIVKGNALALDGVGNDGQVITRAPRIRQTAVNPGIDGQENIVCSTSEIVNQACGIVIQSNNSTDAFSQGPAEIDGKGGIRIHADQSLQLSASSSCERRKEMIEKRVKSLDTRIKDMEQEADNKMKSVEKCLKAMKELLDREDQLNQEGGFAVRQNTKGIEFVHDTIDKLLPTLYQETLSFIRTVSSLAEANRTKKAIETEKSKMPEEKTFRQGATNAHMNIVAEQINMATLDGDNYLHTNAEAGVNIRTPQMDINMTDAYNKLIKGGSLNVTAENVMMSSLEATDDAKEYYAKGSFNVYSKDIGLVSMDFKKTDDYTRLAEKNLTQDGSVMVTANKVQVSTCNPKDIKYDSSGKKTSGEYNAEGDVIFNTKNLMIESLDYQVADGKLKVKAQTADSSVSVRTEKTTILSADAEGKSTGSITANAKAISVKSMDVNKDSLEDAALAQGSTMTLVSEKMYVGSKSDKEKSKKVQMVSEEIGAFADNTFEAQQGNGKATLQLDGGKASVGGDKTQVYGETTINAKTEIKLELKTPKATIDDLEVKSSFKSPNIKDGIAVPKAGAGGSLSPKLKKEDAPKK